MKRVGDLSIISQNQFFCQRVFFKFSNNVQAPNWTGKKYGRKYVLFNSSTVISLWPVKDSNQLHPSPFFFIFIPLPLRSCHFLSGHKEWPHLCKQPWCTKRWRWKYSNSIIYTICQNRRERERKFRNEPRWSSWRRGRRRGDSHPRRPFSICLANQRRNGETLIRLNQLINNLMLTLREALTIC